MNWLDLIKALVPTIVAKALPKASPMLPGIISHGIEIAENAVTHKTGKLDTAIDSIQTTISGINAVKPGTIDMTQANTVIKDVISASVDSANMIHNIPVKQ